MHTASTFTKQQQMDSR